MSLRDAAVAPLSRNEPNRPGALEEALERVSGKWTIPILSAVRRPLRFTQLERSMHGISRRMLTLTLRSLERDGLVVRTVHPTVPPKVEYVVSAPGQELLDSLAPLIAWAERNRPLVEGARCAYRDRDVA